MFDEYLTWVRETRPKLDDEGKKNLDTEFISDTSYKDIKDFLDDLRTERDKKSKDELSKMSFGQSNYSLVPISSFEEFNKLYGGRATGDGSSDKYAGGGGTAWCHANSESVYRTWTNGGKRFFVLQNNNWKNIPFNDESNKEKKGHDAYGNSLIALLTNRYGMLLKATLRCNHVGVPTNADNQYNTYAEISKIAGFNVDEEISKYFKNVEKPSIDKCFKVVDGELVRDLDYME